MALVILNTALFALFAAKNFFHPRTKRDRRGDGAFTAFPVALFTEQVPASGGNARGQWIRDGRTRKVEWAAYGLVTVGCRPAIGSRSCC